MQKAIAQIVRDQLKDPRLGLVTIQAVKVVRDLSQAKVYFTVLQETDHKQIRKTLQNAAGFIRNQLGKMVQLRTLPELIFVYDESIEHGSKLQALIEDAVHKDSQHARQESEGESDGTT